MKTGNRGVGGLRRLRTSQRSVDESLKQWIEYGGPPVISNTGDPYGLVLQGTGTIAVTALPSSSVTGVPPGLGFATLAAAGDVVRVTPRVLTQGGSGANYASHSGIHPRNEPFAMATWRLPTAGLSNTRLYVGLWEVGWAAGSLISAQAVRWASCGIRGDLRGAQVHGFYNATGVAGVGTSVNPVSDYRPTAGTIVQLAVQLTSAGVPVFFSNGLEIGRGDSIDTAGTRRFQYVTGIEYVAASAITNAELLSWRLTYLLDPTS